MISRLTAAGNVIQRGLAALKKKALHFVKMSAYWSGVTAVGLTLSVLIFNLAGGHFTHAAQADGWEVLGIIVGNLLYYTIIGPIGIASILMGYIMQVVISYPYGSFWADNTQGGFVNVSGVQTGWRLVRDVCNVFFSLILVIIALANVLKIEAYSWKTLMPKFILMAILINFSKTIAGVFTDLGTVAMATFGGSFANSFAAGIIGAFGLPSLGDLTGATSSSSLGSGSSGSSVILAYILAAIMTQIFFVVITIYTAILIFRIVMLWFLIVLSPMAYITRILPQTKKYSSQWWEMFGRYVTVGPLITFFLWLSLTMTFGNTVGAATTNTNTAGGNPLSSGISSGVNSSGVSLQAPTSGFTATSPNVMSNFMIALMMLMASLQLVSKMASEAGKITGAVEKFAWGAGGALLSGGSQWLGMQAMRGGGWLSKNGGAAGKVAGGALSGLGGLATVSGATLFNPKFLGNTADAVKSYAKGKSEKLKSDVTNKRDDMLGGGMLSKLGGAALSFGVSPEWALENFVDPNTGIGRMISSALGKSKAQGDVARLDGATGEIQREKDTLEKEQGNYAEHTDPATGATVVDNDGKGDLNRYNNTEEAQRALDEYKNIVGGLGSLDAQLSSGTFDLNSQAVRGSIQASIDQLKAQKAGFEASGLTADAANAQKQISGLEDLLSGKKLSDLKAERDALAKAGKSTSAVDADIARLTTGAGSLTEADLQSLGGSTAITKADLTKALKAREADLERERLARQQKLLNSTGNAAMVGLTGSAAEAALTTFTGSFGGLMSAVNKADPKGRTYAQIVTDAQASITAKENALKRAQTTLAGYRPSDDLGHTAHTAHAVSDASKKIAGVADSGVLMDRLAEAMAKKDRYLAEAIVKKITANGDLDLLTTRFMSRYRDELPAGIELSADAKGLELFRKEILGKKLGMGDHDSLRIANDLSLDAGFNKRQQAFALAYMVDPSSGHLHALDKSKRDAWTAIEFKKKSVRDLMGYGAAQWGRKYLDDAGNMKFEIDDAGLDLVQAFQADLANKHYFAGWSADAKAALSDPEVLAKLRARGVNSQLISALENYRRETKEANRARFAA